MQSRRQKVGWTMFYIGCGMMGWGVGVYLYLLFYYVTH